MRESITIVGASLAGIRAAETLRRDGFTGRITLVGDEPHAPYDRPPLSKQFLSGSWDEDRTALVQPDALAALDLDLRLGVAAQSFHLASRTLTLADGSSLVVDGMLVATGATPRTIPGTEGLTTRFVSLPDSLALSCEATEDHDYLSVAIAENSDPRPLDGLITETLGPSWGLHLVDMTVALDDLVDLATAEAEGYTG